MDDFIFGTLATDDLRLAHIKARRAGITHNHARTPRDPLPGQPVSLDLTVGPAHLCDQAWIYWTDDGSDPAGEGGVARRGFAAPMEQTGAEWDTLLWGYTRRFRATLPPQPAGTLIRYRIAAAPGVQTPRRNVSTPDDAGVSSATEIFADNGAYYAFYVADDPTPAWAQDAIVYQIFVDRFSLPPSVSSQWGEPEGGRGWTPSDFYGGTLSGITANLDYIASLGANVLWLTPIFPSPSHHGYDAADYFEIEPRLGTKADLRALLDAAHARGIRVLLDFAANHWSSGHATFQDAISNAYSQYREWYNFTRWPEAYESFFGVKSLPQINLRNPAARQHMLDAAACWLDFGVDGYRLDYAIGPTPDFWADFRRVTRQHNPECWTFGEVVEPSDRQLSFEGLLDGCLDFMLLEGFRQAFAFGRWDAHRFADYLDRHEAFFPPSFSRPSFLDNHDMNRFLWAAGGNISRLKLAALCQFTLSGPPVVYYGTEVGLSQERDVRQGTRGIPEESRLPMLWGEAQDTNLLDFYRRLAALRTTHPVLCRGDRRTLYTDDAVLVYVRSDGFSRPAAEAATTSVRSDDLSRLLVGLNLSDTPHTVDLPGAWSSPILATAPGCEFHPDGDHTTLNLPPLAGIVLQP